MGKVIYWSSISLDGFIEGAEGDISWTTPSEELHTHFNEQERLIDIHLYGRRMYETMTYWGTADQDPTAPGFIIEYARLWKNKPKIVFSNTLGQVEWNSRLVRGDITAEVAKLKEQPGLNMGIGGADLAYTFLTLGLIDEYWLYVCPIILGGGKPLFRTLSDRINLRLVETRSFGSGVVLLHYQRAGQSQ